MVQLIISIAALLLAIVYLGTKMFKAAKKPNCDNNCSCK
ncbi:MAG: FeoB-associated Cys-rich membrane protein [Bacteroidia bacterium]|nr:FeoB-associated Cys-rich membrane protein [Bacteroidia bacterium]